jgi:cytochrome c
MPTHTLKILIVSIFLTLILAACGGQSSDATQPAAAAGEVRFSAGVLPVFEANCTRCHGAARQNGGLRLDSYTALMAGSSHGAVIVPNDAAGSKLVELITSGAMPRNAAPLPAAEITLISDWIDAGALDN